MVVWTREGGVWVVAGNGVFCSLSDLLQSASAHLELGRGVELEQQGTFTSGIRWSDG